MRASRFMLLVVILVIVAVFIAKQGKRAAPTDNQSAAQNPTAEAAPGASAQSKAGLDKEPQGPLPGSKLAECLRSGRPTMADFGKDWCVPCKMMVPVLKQAVQDYLGKANIVFVNLEQYGDLGGQYRIATMPTQIFFDAKGKEIKRHMGYIGTEDIEQELAALGVKK